MHLARVWSNIACALDWKIEQLVSTKTLVWMPAHLTDAAIGNISKSNRKLVTATDWRANRLVDGLAKHAAAQGAAPKSSTALIESAESLVKHAAAQLAVATFNANNHQVPKVKPDGTVTYCTIRDAQPAPTGAKNKGLLPLRVPPRLLHPRPLPPLQAMTVQPAATAAPPCT